MRVAVSNIAWGPEEDPVALTRLRACGIDGIEIAPTRLWPGWVGADRRSAIAHRRVLEAAGLECPALQAVLFDKPDLQLFGTREQVRGLEDHLRKVAEIAQALGAGVVVFGSPRNRLRHGLALDDAFAHATTVLRRIGSVFAHHGVALAIEANPEAYGCDFVTDMKAASVLVDGVASSGVALHADAGGMALNSEDPALLTVHARGLAHFHASEPYLAPPVDVDRHRILARALAVGGYRGWCSVEMKRSGEGFERVEAAARLAVGCYSQAAT